MTITKTYFRLYISKAFSQPEIKGQTGQYKNGLQTFLSVNQLLQREKKKINQQNK